MSNLSMVEAKLAPGFRFHPRDEELVCDYLMMKVSGYELEHPRMIVVDLNKCEPWDIPESACVGGKEWYFYSKRDRKYATGLRTNRATVSGYWKATGKDRPVLRKGTLVGMRKTLVFYQGRAPKGTKTCWVMHEFRLEGPLALPKVSSQKEEDWVLCRVFFKNIPTTKQDGDDVSPSSSSSSLPPLMEPYISYGQTDHYQKEQVPCFSIIHSDQTSQPFSYLTHIHMDHHHIPNFSTQNINVMPNLIASSPNLPYFGPYLNSSTSDKNVVKAVLNELTKMENDNNQVNNIKASPGFGEADSYLSEAALSTMWNQY